MYKLFVIYVFVNSRLFIDFFQPLFFEIRHRDRSPASSTSSLANVTSFPLVPETNAGDSKESSSKSETTATVPTMPVTPRPDVSIDLMSTFVHKQSGSGSARRYSF